MDFVFSGERAWRDTAIAGGGQAPVTIQISGGLFCIVAYDTAHQFYAILVY